MLLEKLIRDYLNSLSTMKRFYTKLVCQQFVESNTSRVVKTQLHTVKFLTVSRSTVHILHASIKLLFETWPLITFLW
jgi:hypothetical protein